MSRFLQGGFRGGPFLLFVIFFIGVNVFVHFWHSTLIRQRQENLLAASPGDNASNKTPARWDRSTGEHPENFFPMIPDATKTRLAIVSGMSQMYAVNDPKPGDEIIVEHLDDALAPRGVRAFGLSAPNMHNEEALFLLQATTLNAKTRPKFFIYGVCFDKFRNIDLRPGFQRMLFSNPDLARNWRQTAERYRGRFPGASEKMLASLLAAEGAGKQEDVSFEHRLRTGAAMWLPLVAAREDLNAYVMMKLFELRNFVFNINPQSKRPILQARYELNREFLQMIAQEAARNGVQPIFYVIPLNPLADNPYIPAQYAAFKQWLEALCREQGIPFANLEGVVPSGHWGTFMGGPDFKHFRGEGHAITAREILKAFGPVLTAGGGAG